MSQSSRPQGVSFTCRFAQKRSGLGPHWTVMATADIASQTTTNSSAIKFAFQYRLSIGRRSSFSLSFQATFHFQRINLFHRFFIFRRLPPDSRRKSMTDLDFYWNRHLTFLLASHKILLVSKNCYQAVKPE